MEFRDDGCGPGNLQMMYDDELWHWAETGPAELRWRCYSFFPEIVTVGRAEKNIPVGPIGWQRRPTGGRQLYHCADFSYAVAASRSHPLFAGNLRDTYMVIARLWVKCLRRLGCQATLAVKSKPYRQIKYCCETVIPGDIMVAGRKLVSSAQRRGRVGVLQHGSMALVPNYGAAARALGCEESLLKQKNISLQEAVGEDVQYERIVACWNQILREEEERWQKSICAA